MYNDHRSVYEYYHDQQYYFTNIYKTMSILVLILFAGISTGAYLEYNKYYTFFVSLILINFISHIFKYDICYQNLRLTVIPFLTGVGVSPFVVDYISPTNILITSSVVSLMFYTVMRVFNMFLEPEFIITAGKKITPLTTLLYTSLLQMYFKYSIYIMVALVFCVFIFNYMIYETLDFVYFQTNYYNNIISDTYCILFDTLFFSPMRLHSDIRRFFWLKKHKQL